MATIKDLTNTQKKDMLVLLMNELNYRAYPQKNNAGIKNCSLSVEPEGESKQFINRGYDIDPTTKVKNYKWVVGPAFKPASQPTQWTQTEPPGGK